MDKSYVIKCNCNITNDNTTNDDNTVARDDNSTGDHNTSSYDIPQIILILLQVMTLCHQPSDSNR